MKRPPPSEIPDQPGAYLFRDANGQVIYVGKAKSLRKRLASYFSKSLASRTMLMMAEADAVEWMIAANEAEAILLEFNLIKEHQPRFNVLLRDDKSFPFLAVTLNEEWPRPMVMRGGMKKGVRYYGPYVQAHAIRETLDLLIRTFPLRTCSNNKLRSHELLGRPCLYYHIERCAGPCVGEVTKDEYESLVGELCRFLDGDQAPVVSRLESEMQEASDSLDFERAARKRDELAAIRKVVDRQQALSARSESFDAIAVVDDEIEASIQVFSVRGGRLIGRRGYVVEKSEELSRAEMMLRVLQGVYIDAQPGEESGNGGGARPHHIPRQVLLQVEPSDAAAAAQFLSEIRGAKVDLRAPARGEKRELMETVRQNAADALARHKLKRSADHGARAKALTALQEALDLPEAPLRIECFDISNTGPSEIVGSMVVLEDGLPKPRDYRRFKVRGQEGQDDFAAMAEVVRRRFTKYLEEQAEPPDPGKPAKFSYRPNLVVIDGGPGQLNAAVRVLADLDISDIALAGLAKRFEELYLPGRADPVVLERGSDSLHVLQRVRDEAHRFAIAYHRKLRDKKMVRSELDEIEGVGDVRKKRLLRHFGSLKRLRLASQEEIASVPGIPEPVAAAVYAALSGTSKRPEVT